MTTTITVQCKSGPRAVPTVWQGTTLAIHHPITPAGTPSTEPRWWAVTHKPTGLMACPAIDAPVQTVKTLASAWDQEFSALDPVKGAAGWPLASRWLDDVSRANRGRPIIGPRELTPLAQLESAGTVAEINAAVARAMGYEPALKFHLTRVSSNAKTGPIPVSTSSAKTCPTTCPFMGNGCYASSGPVALHWAAVTRGDRGTSWAEFLRSVADLPPGQLWRHNQAGDLYKPGTKVGATALEALTAANRGRRGFTYSHHPLTPATVQAFKAATANGFTVNASCETARQADRAISKGLRAVFVVPSNETRHHWRTPDGNPVVLCPAQRFDGMTCQRCRLCASRPQNVAIAFKAHGSGKARIDAALAAYD